MMSSRQTTVTLVCTLALMATMATSIGAQVGKGLIDPNVAAEGTSGHCPT